jgi:hypothetical protein
VLSTAEDLDRYGAGNLRWMLSLAVACLAAVPLEDRSRKGLPWQLQLRRRTSRVGTKRHCDTLFVM